jgi:hypothetical protein
MIYSILIYEAPGLDDARSPEERERVLDAHRQLQIDTKQSGEFIAATQLAESGAITTRPRKDDALVTDGPFAETKELFVGFYLFECADLEQAISLAKRIPVSEMGGVEIRPAVWSESIGHEPQ